MIRSSRQNSFEINKIKSVHFSIKSTNMDNFEVAQELPNYKEIILDRSKYFKSDYETLPIPDLDMDYFHKQNTIDMMG